MATAKTTGIAIIAPILSCVLTFAITAARSRTHRIGAKKYQLSLLQFTADADRYIVA
jgi:hypothetical protein